MRECPGANARGGLGRLSTLLYDYAGMSLIRLVACFTALGLGVCLFAQSRAPLPAVVVEGVIRDAETRAPIPNARVVVRGEQRALSGGDGRFEFKVPPPETVVMRAELEGFP